MRPASTPREVHHRVPRCLLRLRERAEFHTELDGEGLALWMDYELEALRCGVDPDVSRDELAALIEGSTVARPWSSRVKSTGTATPQTSPGGAGAEGS